MGNYSLQSIKERQHGIPAPNAETGILSSITWTKIMCRCIHRSADVTTKAVVGITTLRKSIFKSILNTELPMISLLTGKEQSRRK